ncbi:MAG: MOSC domain-containing protein [Eubacteriales bacterium]|nr:MOSC domain-containing protein [Eubacteriales bacterium]
MGCVRGVCISKARKTSAERVGRCMAEEKGLVGDIHYGFGDKQVSLLPYDRVKGYFEEAGEAVRFGRFGENLVAEGIDWDEIRVGSRFVCGEALLEVVKIGAGGPASEAYKGEKVCTPMEPYFVFCKVIKGGELREGSPIQKEEEV